MEGFGESGVEGTVVRGDVFLGGVEGSPDGVAVEVQVLPEAEEVRALVGEDNQEPVAGSAGAGFDRVVGPAGSPGPS